MQLYNGLICALAKYQRRDILELIRADFILDDKYKSVYQSLCDNVRKGFWYSLKDLEVLYPNIKWEFNDNIALEDIANKVITHWATQELRRTFKRSISKSQDIKDIVKNLRKSISEIDYYLNNTAIRVENIADNIGIDWYKMYANKKRYKLGWPTLNDILGGLMVNKFWIILGKYKIGKTFFILKMAFDLWTLDKANVLFCSAEMSADEVKLRLMGIITHIPHDVLIKNKVVGTLYEDIYNNGVAYINSIPNKLLVVGKGNFTISSIEQIIRNNKIDVVFVDSFYLLGEGHSEYERVNNATNELLRLCKEYDIAMVVTSQFAREGIKAKSDDNTDQSINAAYSLNTVRLADVAIGLFQDKTLELQKMMCVGVLTSRYSAKGNKFLIHWDLDSSMFDEVVDKTMPKDMMALSHNVHEAMDSEFAQVNGL